MKATTNKFMEPSNFSFYSFLTLLVIGIILFVIIYIAAYTNKLEGFTTDNIDGENYDNTNNILLESSLNIGKQIQSAKTDSEIKTLMHKMMGELIAVGAMPDTSQFVRKNELHNQKCIVSNATDRDHYVAKSSMPAAGPRIDMSQYVKKSAIPACPESKCPPIPDLSEYVKKSTLYQHKNQACISPRVKVSAGLCKECPPCPSQLCPACPVQPKLNCPAPEPCQPLQTQPVRYEVKYIKVPTIITKTVVVDINNNVLSQKIETKETNDNNPNPGNQKPNPNISSMNLTATPTSAQIATANTTQTAKFNSTLASLPNNNESCLFKSEINSDYKCKGGLPGINNH